MSLIIVERTGSVARLIFNRPDNMNAVNESMRLEIVESLGQLLADPMTRAIILTGAGKHFCAGGDLKAFYSDEIRSMVFDTDELVVLPRMLATSPKPTIAVVSGACVGGGLGLALGCDYVLTDGTGRFGAPFFNIGIPPDTGVLYFLARRLGLQGARRFLLDNRLVEAEEASSLGLADRLIENDILQDEAMRLAEHLAALPPRALGNAKALMHVIEPNIDAFFARELEGLRDCFGGAEFVEGTSAFFEKRSPRF